MTKNFDSWNILKKKLDGVDVPPLFNEREIWWCSIGVNIGTEMYGKGGTFTRPVLVLKKFSKNSFLGIPLTTKIKDRFGYYKFSFKEEEVCAVMSDIKKMDSRRLGDKMGELSENKFRQIKLEIEKLIFSPQ